MSKKEWRDAPVVIFAGSADTRKHSGGDYDTMTLGELWGMETPGSAYKMQATAMIPSSYAAWDARTHEVQRDRGDFVALTLDVDGGNLGGEAVASALRSFAGDGVATLVYSSSSAAPDERKWRGVVPLSEPVSFERWELLQHALYSHFHRVSGVRPDYALARAGQPVYLPNVPASRRGDDGEPLFFRRHATGGGGLYSAAHSVQSAVDAVLSERAAIAQAHEKAREAARQAVAHRVAQYGDGDKALDLVARFNGANSVANLLAANGYTQRGNSDDWRSPYQSTGTYATRDFGDYWVSLSESDAKAKVGRNSSGSGSVCFGDAFDLYCHFEHGGNFKEAIKAIAAEERGDRRNDYARFEPATAHDDFAAFINQDGDGALANFPAPAPAPAEKVAPAPIDCNASVLESAIERMRAATLTELIGEIPSYIDELRGIDEMALSALAGHYKKCMTKAGATITAKDARARITNKALERQIAENALAQRAEYEKASGSSEMLMNWVYLEQSEKFVNLRDGRALSSKSFDMVYAKDVPPPPDKEKPPAAHRFFALQEGRTAYAQMYVPSMWCDGAGGQFFEHEMRHYLNGYNGHTVPRESAGWEQRPNYQIVQSHIRKLMGTESEAKLMTQWIAHNVQHPGLKILWSPVVYGPQGSGKTTIERIMSAAMGQENVRTVSMDEVYSSFTSWAEGACVRFIEEIRIVGHSRHDLMNKLKPYITNERIKVVRKGEDGLDALNTQNYCCFTNFEDAIVLDDEDRRYGVFSTAAKTRADVTEMFDKAYWKELYEVINNHAGDVRAWLLSVDLSDFDRIAAPPMTRAKMDMIEATRGDDAENLEMVLAHGGLGISKDVVSTSHVNGALKAAGFAPLTARRLGKALKEIGFLPYKKPVKFDDKTCRFAVRGKWLERIAGTAERDDGAIPGMLRNAVKPDALSEFGDS